MAYYSNQTIEQNLGQALKLINSPFNTDSDIPSVYRYCTVMCKCYAVQDLEQINGAYSCLMAVMFQKWEKKDFKFCVVYQHLAPIRTLGLLVVFFFVSASCHARH